jgi:hypothetical protein
VDVVAAATDSEAEEDAAAAATDSEAEVAMAATAAVLEEAEKVDMDEVAVAKVAKAVASVAEDLAEATEED